MEIKITEQSGIPVVALEGEIDLYNARDITDATNRLAAEGNLQIVVNLGKLTYIDSTGIGVFLSVHKHLKARGGSLKFVAVPASVTEVFKLARLYSYFEIHHSEEEALAAFGDT